MVLLLCDKCKKRPAVFHHWNIVNGSKSEEHLCEECAAAQGQVMENLAPAFGLPNLLQGLFQAQPALQGAAGAFGEERCEACGLTTREFRQNGQFGCRQCYEKFDGMLDSLFRRLHGNTQHTGKVPKTRGGRLRVKRRLDELRRELKEAVSQEAYERAAELRDEIRELEKQLGEMSGSQEA